MLPGRRAGNRVPQSPPALVPVSVRVCPLRRWRAPSGARLPFVPPRACCLLRAFPNCFTVPGKFIPPVFALRLLIDSDQSPPCFACFLLPPLGRPPRFPFSRELFAFRSDVVLPRQA